MKSKLSYFFLFIFIFISQNSFAGFDSVTSIDLPAEFGNMSPGPDFLWGSGDDETDLATQFPSEVGRNTLGAASYGIDSNGGRSYQSGASVTSSFVNSTTVAGEEVNSNTISLNNEFQGDPLNGFVDGVGGTQTGAANPRGTFKVYANNSYSYSVTDVDSFGNTLVKTSTFSHYINNGDNPVTIFGAGALADNFNFLITALTNQSVAWQSLFYEIGTFTITAGPSAGLTGTYSFAATSTTPVTLAASDFTIINLPNLVNRSPGADFLWNTGDDEASISALFPGDVGRNTIGAAGFAIDSNGGRSYSGIGGGSDAATGGFVIGTTLPGEAFAFGPLSNGQEFQGLAANFFIDGVLGTQSRETNPNGTGRFYRDHTYEYTVTSVNTFGDTSSSTSPRTSYWINNGEDPVVIFGAGDIATNMQFLIDELNSAMITWGAIGYELGSFTVTAGPNAGLTGDYSFGTYRTAPITFGAAPIILTPTNGTTLTSDSVDVTWNLNGAVGITRLAVRAGSGGSGTFDLSAPPVINDPMATMDTLTGLPTDGSTFTIDLYAEFNNSNEFLIVDTRTVTAVTAAPPAITSPADMSTLGGTTVNVTWAANATPGITRWAVRAGTASGLFDIAAPPVVDVAVTSQMLTGLPIDGSTFFIDLYAETSGVFNIVDTIQVTAASPGTPVILTPANSSTLTGSSETVTWDPLGTAATSWRVDAGNMGAMSNNLASTTVGAGSTSAVLNGLPTDGSTITLSLFFDTGGGFTFAGSVDVTAATIASPQITAPLAAATLTDGTASVTWDQMGTVATAWAVRAGSGGTGTFDLAAPPILGAGATSDMLTGLPVDGSTITIDLYAEVGGVFSIVDTIDVTAFTAPAPDITSPVAASTLGDDEVTVTWDPMGNNNVTRWAIRAGSGGTGTFDLAAPPVVDAAVTSQMITGLPSDGSTITFDLYAEVNGAFSIVDTIDVTAYTAPVPQITAPLAAATLTDGTASVTWDPMGTTVVTQWAVRAGSGGTGTFDLAAPAVVPFGTTSQMLTGLPVDGSTITIDLYAEVNGVFSIVDTLDVTAFTAPAPTILTPTAGATLTDGTANVTWDQMGVAATRYAVRAGSGGTGTFDLAAPPLLDSMATSQMLTGLPVDGSTITIDLYAEVGGVFSIVDTINVTAHTANPVITAPTNGSTIFDGSVNVTWDPDGHTNVTRWAIRAGSTGTGSFDLAAPPLVDAATTSQMLTGLPTDDSTITIDLYAEVDGAFSIVHTIDVTGSLAP